MTQTAEYRTAKLIDDAADLIEEKGWCRGRFADGDRHCTLGALRAVDPKDRYGYLTHAYYVAFEAVAGEVEKVAPGEGVAGWNDAQRDRRKVVRLLRRTARKVRRSEIPVWP